MECRDLLEDAPRWLRAAYPLLYLFLVRHCAALWGIGYAFLDHPALFRLAQPLRRACNLAVGRRFIERIRRTAPDAIVVTHFFPADLVGACQQAGWFTRPLIVVVTDLHPHRFWLSNKAQAVVVGTPAALELVQRCGVERARLHLLGIPIGTGPAEMMDRESLLDSFGLSSSGRRTVLVTSGGTTVGPFEPMVRELMQLEPGSPGLLQLLVVCGENDGARERLARLAAHALMPVTVLGFINRMPEAMVASDVIVAKAGGLTVAEALGHGRPLVLYHVIPGQERANAELVCRHGAGVMAHRPSAVANAVRELVEDGGRLAAMSEAARLLGRPDAAHRIAEEVVKPLLKQ